MNGLMMNKNYIDLVEEAMLRLGESAPDTVEQVLSAPHMKLFTGALKAYEASDGARVFRATASSTIEDLHGDTMTEDCVRDMAQQARNGPIGKGLTIFLNHQYKVPEDVAGKVAASQVLNRVNDADTGLPIWDMDYEIRLATGSSRIDQTWNLIKNDEITLGISIGAYILEYDYKDKEAGFWGGLIINKVLLVETSIVGIPANQRSWIQNAVIAIGKSLGFEEKQVRRVLDGKEAPPIMKTAAADGIIKTPIEVPADGTVVILEGTPVNSPEEQTAEPKITDGDTDPVPPDAESSEAEEAEEPQVAEAAPVQESTAEQTTEPEVEETDGETTEAAAPALESIAPEIALSISAGQTPELELVLSAFEAAAKELRATREQNATLTSENEALTKRVEKAEQDVDDAFEIIQLVAKSPLGRKTQFAGPVRSFTSKFGHIYDERYLKLMDETE